LPNFTSASKRKQKIIGRVDSWFSDLSMSEPLTMPVSNYIFDNPYCFKVEDGTIHGSGGWLLSIMSSHDCW
jgi:hypothetical protein